jgi:hypothetical protein
LAFHSDAGVKRDSIIGTLMIYTDFDNDKSKTYPTGVSRQLARDYGDYMQSQIVNDVRALYAPHWMRRQLHNSSYAEARHPKVPAVLLELLSHQNYDDMRYGLDPRVKFTISRAIYKGMLRFIHAQYGTEVVVQPLPVQKMAMRREARGEEARGDEAKGERREVKGKEKHPCFLCSWYRRKALFDVAQELGCNKIALGHHKDDLVETLLMNLIFQGSVATIPPLLQMEKMPIEMIRPLCLIEEKDIQEYAELSGYEKQVKLCPLEKVSNRTEVKRLLAQLEALNPNVRDSIWGAMENIKPDYLPKKG